VGLLPRQNRRPDEEGIKTVFQLMNYWLLSQNRRPDEEGIKTFCASNLPSESRVKTVDLMKKGLRPRDGSKSCNNAGQNRRPDEEGIKTRKLVIRLTEPCQNRRPDEEGIKTS